MANIEQKEYKVSRLVFLVVLFLVIASLDICDKVYGTNIMYYVSNLFICFLGVAFGGFLYDQIKIHYLAVWANMPLCLFVLTVITALIAIFAALFGYYNELPDTYMDGVGGLAILTVIVSGVVYIPRAYKWL